MRNGGGGALPFLGVEACRNSGTLPSRAGVMEYTLVLAAADVLVVYHKGRFWRAPCHPVRLVDRGEVVTAPNMTYEVSIPSTNDGKWSKMTKLLYS